MLALAALVLVALTFAEWRAMAHQWWNIDTYSHILLVPPIIAWLGWIRRDELARAGLQGWWPGLAWLVLGLAVWFVGREIAINTILQRAEQIQLATDTLHFNHHLWHRGLKALPVEFGLSGN